MDEPTPRPTVTETVWRWREGAAPTDVRRQPVLGRLVRMIVIMALVGAFAWWRDHRAVVRFLGCFAAANVAAAAFVPGVFHWHARLWERLGRGGAVVIGAVLLTLAYYLFFTPAALIIRLLGRQPLPLRFPGPEGTHWRDVPEREHTEEYYEKQFG